MTCCIIIRRVDACYHTRVPIPDVLGAWYRYLVLVLVRRFASCSSSQQSARTFAECSGVEAACVPRAEKNMSNILRLASYTSSAVASLTLPGTISSISVFLLWYGAMGSTYHSGQLMLLAPLLPACLAPLPVDDTLEVVPAINSRRLPLRPDVASAVLLRSLSDRPAQSLATTALEAQAAVAVVPVGLRFVARW